MQGVWQQCKTEILIYGQQKKETQRTCTTKNYVNDHLYKKTGPILHQFDQSREIGKKA